MIEERELTPKAQADRDDFENYYGDRGNCSCHVSPPCGSCTHPGNPLNQGDDDCYVMAEAIEPREITTYGYGIGMDHERYVSGFKTGEDALSAALDEADVDGERYVWLYELAPYVYQGGKCAAMDLIERITEEAGDAGVVDEHGDDAFLDGVKPADVDMLAELIDAWANAHGGRHDVVKRKELYIDGQWMPAGRKLETFGWQARIDINEAAKRLKLLLLSQANAHLARLGYWINSSGALVAPLTGAP